MTEFNRRNGSGGFSLIEVTIAIGIMAGALVALAQMLAVSVANNRGAKTLTYTTVLAEQKMEQLRSLTWGFDNLGVSVGDTTTNTADPLEASNAGTGLSLSPPDTMTTNTAGWVDYVDRFGVVLGAGAMPPPKTVYIRRWAIEPLPSDPANAVVIHVLVTASVNRGPADAAASTARLPGEARLVSVKTRKGL